MKLQRGDRIKINARTAHKGRIGKHATVVGYGQKSMRAGRECYWVILDGTVTRVEYHVCYLDKLKGGEMNPTKIFNSTGLRKLYNDLKLKVKAQQEENNYLRDRQIRLLEKLNKLLRKVLNNCGV